MRVDAKASRESKRKYSSIHLWLFHPLSIWLVFLIAVSIIVRHPRLICTKACGAWQAWKWAGLPGWATKRNGLDLAKSAAWQFLFLPKKAKWMPSTSFSETPCMPPSTRSENLSLRKFAIYNKSCIGSVHSDFSSCLWLSRVFGFEVVSLCRKKPLPSRLPRAGTLLTGIRLANFRSTSATGSYKGNPIAPGSSSTSMWRMQGTLGDCTAGRQNRSTQPSFPKFQ